MQLPFGNGEGASSDSEFEQWIKESLLEQKGFERK